MTNRKLLALLIAVGVAAAVLTGATTYALLTDRETVDVHVPDNVSAAANQPSAIGIDAGQAPPETDAPNPAVPPAHELPAIAPNHAGTGTQTDQPVWGGDG